MSTSRPPSDAPSASVLQQKRLENRVHQQRKDQKVKIKCLSNQSYEIPSHSIRGKIFDHGGCRMGSLKKSNRSTEVVQESSTSVYLRRLLEGSVTTAEKGKRRKEEVEKRKAFIPPQHTEVPLSKVQSGISKKCSGKFQRNTSSTSLIQSNGAQSSSSVGRTRPLSEAEKKGSIVSTTPIVVDIFGTVAASSAPLSLCCAVKNDLSIVSSRPSTSKRKVTTKALSETTSTSKSLSPVDLVVTGDLTSMTNENIRRKTTDEQAMTNRMQADLEKEVGFDKFVQDNKTDENHRSRDRDHIQDQQQQQEQHLQQQEQQQKRPRVSNWDSGNYSHSVHGMDSWTFATTIRSSAIADTNSRDNTNGTTCTSNSLSSHKYYTTFTNNSINFNNNEQSIQNQVNESNITPLLSRSYGVNVTLNHRKHSSSSTSTRSRTKESFQRFLDQTTSDVDVQLTHANNIYTNANNGTNLCDVVHPPHSKDNLFSDIESPSFQAAVTSTENLTAVEKSLKMITTTTVAAAKTLEQSPSSSIPRLSLVSSDGHHDDEYLMSTTTTSNVSAMDERHQQNASHLIPALILNHNKSYNICNSTMVNKNITTSKQTTTNIYKTTSDFSHSHDNLHKNEICTINDKYTFGINSHSKKNNNSFQETPVTTTEVLLPNATSINKTTNKKRTGNYVRLNLRNRAGSCLGARNKKTKSKSKLNWEIQRKAKQRIREDNANDDINNRGDIVEAGFHRTRSVSDTIPTSMLSTPAGVDPIDDFIDGILHSPRLRKADTATNRTQDLVPLCKGHSVPCQLRTVKKSGINKGRPFYACSYSSHNERGCNYFEWADNKPTAIQDALAQNVHTSTFIKRHVSSYIDLIRKQTVPELRNLCAKHGLDHTKSKKAQLLARLAIWVRDEVTKSLQLQHEDKDNSVVSDELERGLKTGSDRCMPSPCNALDIHKGNITAQTKKTEQPRRDDNSHYTQVNISYNSCYSATTTTLSKILDQEYQAKAGDLNISTSKNTDTTPKYADSHLTPISDTVSYVVDNSHVGNDDNDCKRDTNYAIDAKYDGSECDVDDENYYEANDDDTNKSDENDDDDDSDEDDELEFIGADTVTTEPKLAKPTPVTSLRNCSLEIVLHTLFGYDSFRDGQEWAIRRCINGQRSLLVAPTGFGKSLCYTLPAAIMDGICIVVSPLLSLIQDQMQHLPARVPAATLSGSMSTSAMATTLDDISRGRIKILFVSPERLTSSSFRRLFRRKWNVTDMRRDVRIFPPVSLLCVDEAHCLSQWAHNFRPSYLRLRSLMDLIAPRSVLAITATAGPRVIQDICQSLNIFNPTSNATDTNDNMQATPENHPRTNTIESGVRVGMTNRDNIDVCCHILNSEGERLGMLIKILSSSSKGTFQNKHSNDSANDNNKYKSNSLEGCLASGSVIVYVWRQWDAQIVAENIQSAGNVVGGVVVYHGGMDAHERRQAQSMFMRGRARICVATIAFGLGINKADVVGVIHMYLSSSPEHYLQEIGRAGRNGLPAKAVALILNHEVIVKHSLSHTDAISSGQVEAILQYLCQRTIESLTSLPLERCRFHPIYLSFPLSIAFGCDCKVETIETIMSLLEQRNNGKPSLLFIEGISYDVASIAPKRGSLEKLAELEPVARAILQCATIKELPIDDSKLSKSWRTQQPDKDFDTEGDNQRNFQNNFHNDDRLRSVRNVHGYYSFSVAQCANCLGDTGEPRHVYAALRRLEASGEIDLILQTQPQDRSLSIRLTCEGMRVLGSSDSELITYKSSKGSSDTALASTAMELLERFDSTIHACANKVLDIYYILKQVSKVTASGVNSINKSHSLRVFQDLIEQYFAAEGRGESLAVSLSLREPSTLPQYDDDGIYHDVQLLNDVRDVLSFLKDVQANDQQQRESCNVVQRLIHISYCVSPSMTLGLYTKSSSSPNAVATGILDHTGLMITKFLHGIAHIPGTYSCFRNHFLFGKMQKVRFDKLYHRIRGILGLVQTTSTNSINN